MEGESREDYQACIFPDLQSSIDLIRDNLGCEVFFFAYPFGQRESWASSYLKEHFSISVTTRHGPADLSGGLYNLPRHNISMKEPVSKFLPA